MYSYLQKLFGWIKDARSCHQCLNSLLFNSDSRIYGNGGRLTINYVCVSILTKVIFSKPETASLPRRLPLALTLMNYYESLSYCGEEGEPIRAHFVMMEGQRMSIDCAGDIWEERQGLANSFILLAKARHCPWHDVAQLALILMSKR